VYEKHQLKATFVLTLEREKRAMSTLRKEDKNDRILQTLAKAEELTKL
jgi:hypothetical protein